MDLCTSGLPIKPCAATWPKTLKELKKNDQRQDFIRAYFDKNDKNKIVPFPKQDSSMINLFSKCDCLILRKPFEKKSLKNTKINFIKFPDLI